MVQVVENVAQNVAQAQRTGVNINWDLIILITIIAVILAVLFLLLHWIIGSILKKIKNTNKKKEDLEYYKYDLDLKMCQLNKDSKLKYRTWYTLFLGWRKAKIYAYTEFGKKFIGYYDGEATKKEDFFLLSIEQRYSFFKREIDVVIIPYQLRKKLLKKNADFSVDIYCEGIDEVMSSQYYSIPVIKYQSNEEKKLFMDFSNLVLEKYFKEYVYRDVIKSTAIEFKNNVKEAVEMNPNIQYGRKSNNNLQQ